MRCTKKAAEKIYAHKFSIPSTILYILIIFYFSQFPVLPTISLCSYLIQLLHSRKK